MKATTISALIAALLLSSGLAIAQPPAPMELPSPPSPPGWGMKRGPSQGMMGHCRGLNLTEEQRAEISKLRLEHQREMVELRSDMVALRNKLKLQITADKFNQSEVDGITAKLSKLHQKLTQMHVKHLRQVREKLTPDQRVKFDSKVLSCEMGPGHGRGQRMMGPRGHGQKGGRRPW